MRTENRRRRPALIARRRGEGRTGAWPRGKPRNPPRSASLSRERNRGKSGGRKQSRRIPYPCPNDTPHEKTARDEKTARGPQPYSPARCPSSEWRQEKQEVVRRHRAKHATNNNISRYDMYTSCRNRPLNPCFSCEVFCH